MNSGWDLIVTSLFLCMVITIHPSVLLFSEILRMALLIEKDSIVHSKSRIKLIWIMALPFHLWVGV